MIVIVGETQMQLIMVHRGRLECWQIGLKLFARTITKYMADPHTYARNPVVFLS